MLNPDFSGDAITWNNGGISGSSREHLCRDSLSRPVSIGSERAEELSQEEEGVREREREGSVYEMAPGRGFNSRRARFLSRRLRSITIYLVLLIAFFLFTLIYISRKGLEGVGQKGTSSEEVRSERVCFLLALAYSGSYSLMGCRQVVILIS